MIFSEPRNYVEQKYGRGTWDTLLVKADLKGRAYLASGVYSDGEVIAPVSAASAMTAQTTSVLLEEFGAIARFCFKDSGCPACLAEVWRSRSPTLADSSSVNVG
jgi:hypothetical protein